jgi:hypothetical protein
MAHKKTHRRSHRRRKETKGNILNKTINKSYSVAQETSKKYMPKVKSGIEHLGSNVTETAKESVPYLQRLTRRVLDMIGIRTRKSGRSRGFVW